MSKIKLTHEKDLVPRKKETTVSSTPVMFKNEDEIRKHAQQIFPLKSQNIDRTIFINKQIKALNKPAVSSTEVIKFCQWCQIDTDYSEGKCSYCDKPDGSRPFIEDFNDEVNRMKEDVQPVKLNNLSPSTTVKEEDIRKEIQTSEDGLENELSENIEQLKLEAKKLYPLHPCQPESNYINDERRAEIKAHIRARLMSQQEISRLNFRLNNMWEQLKELTPKGIQELIKWAEDNEEPGNTRFGGTVINAEKFFAKAESILKQS